MDEQIARISGKYVLISTIITVIVGLFGTFGGIWYQSTKTESIQVDLHLKQEEVDQLTQDKQVLQNDNTALEQKVAELESQLVIVQGEQDETTNRLKQQYDELKKEDDELKKQNEELKKQYSEISAQNAAIKVQLDNMGIDIPQTKDSPEENSTLDSDSVWLSNLDWLDKSGDWDIGNVSRSNTGIEYSHSINNTDYDSSKYSSSTRTHFREYKIYGQYSKITGYFYQEYNYRSSDGSTTLRFYGDDKTLLNKETLTVYRGADPIYFEIDVTGVTNLTIELDGKVGCTSLGEVALWK